METGPAADVQQWQETAAMLPGRRRPVPPDLTERQIAVAKLTEQASHGDDQLRQHDKMAAGTDGYRNRPPSAARICSRRQEEAARLLTELSKNITLKEADTVR